MRESSLMYGLMIVLSVSCLVIVAVPAEEEAVV